MSKCRNKSPSGNTETQRVTWQGIELEIRFERDWFNMRGCPYHWSHLEVESVTPPRVKLPITETGYRSHFVSAEAVDAAGGPVAYIVGWLDEAALSNEWKAHQSSQRQLSLF